MPSIPFERFRHKVLGLYSPASYAPGTVRNVLQVLRELDELRADGGKVKLVKSSADLGADTILAWLAAHPARKSRRFEALLRTLQPLVKFAIQLGHFPRDSDPFEFRSARKWMTPGTRAVHSPRRQFARPVDQIAAFLYLLDTEAADGGWKECRLQALAYLLFYTGMRKMEALQLPKANVSLDHRALLLAPRPDWSPKTVKSARTLPIAGPLHRVLIPWMPMISGSDWLIPGVRLKTPWTSGMPGTKPLDVFKAAAKRAGLGDDFCFIGARKSLCTHSAAMGITDEQRRTTLGHSTVETARRWYEEPSLDGMRETVDKINYLPAPPRLQIA